MAPMKKLTEPQQAVYDFYKNFYGIHGFYPTITHAKDALGWSSVSLVLYHLRGAEKKGAKIDRFRYKRNFFKG